MTGALQQQLDLFLAIVAVAFGATIGSFLNVVIFRLPEGRSIAFPASHCPKCKYNLRWYDNIPILSWLSLRGRCRKCRQRISFQYPLVEALNALLYYLVYREFGMSAATILYCLLASAFLALVFIDLRWYILPDEFTLPGLAIGLIVAAVHSVYPIAGLRVAGFTDAILGVLLGGGVLYAVAVLGSQYLRWKIKRFGAGAQALPEHARRDDDDEAELETMAMGAGDIKFLAMAGAFVGWKGAYLALLLGSCVGALVGLTLMLVRRGGLGLRIPFGPYLVLGALVALLFPDEAQLLYQNLLVAISHAMGAPAPPMGG